MKLWAFSGYGFSPADMRQLQGDKYWSGCPDQQWPRSNCCPLGLTEQYYFENAEEYTNHPAVLLVQSDSDLTSDANGSAFYHQAMRGHGARSLKATWPGSMHGITPFAFGVAASYVTRAVRGGG